MGFSCKNGRFETKQGHLVQWVHIQPERIDSKGVIFALPLVGGAFSHEIKNMRKLIRNGYDVFSFNFTGHGKSSGKFRLKSTLDNTAEALDFLIRRSNGKPLYAVASCYSAIPLIHAAHSKDEPIKKIALINAVCHINPKAVFNAFLSYHRNALDGRLSVTLMNETFRRYMAFLFPGINISRHVFGALLRSRTDVIKTLWDVLIMNPLASVRLERTPVLGLYGKQDRILRMYDGDVGVNYERQILEKCPRTTFHPLHCDHYLSSRQSRELARNTILAFFG